MKNLIELSKEDLLTFNGGGSFAFRIGQIMSIIFDLTLDGTPGCIDSMRGNKILTNWFGS